MKITIPVEKPRAKWLNDILRNKRSTAHSTPRFPSREKQKREFEKRLNEGLV